MGHAGRHPGQAVGVHRSRRRPGAFASRWTPVAAPSPSWTATSRCWRRAPTPTGWSASSTSRRRCPGLRQHNTANALAAAAAALGLGLPRDAVIEGLRTFAPDERLNPGRMNTYTMRRADGGAITVIVDLAHNEAGLEALLDVAHGLRGPGGAGAPGARAGR